MYYYYDESGVAGFEYNGAKYHYIKNLQGDIVSIYNNNGAVVVNYTYDAWGNVLSVTGSMADTIGAINPFRYRGYYYDTETGFYYLQSRYYDSIVGRWVNSDGVGLLGYGLQNIVQYNMFGYCFNSLIMFYDPTGSFPTLNDLKKALEETVDNLMGGLLNTAIKYGNYFNNLNQQSNIPDDFIDNQNELSYMHMGLYGADWNGCGWIAVYNAMRMLGKQPNAADIIKFFDNAGNTYLYGTFGARPSTISEYLTLQNLTGKMNTIPFIIPDNVETVAKKASACIVLYVYNSGAHYVAMRWNGTAYEVYNDYGFRYSSIEEYMNTVEGIMMNIWCID